MAPYEAKCGVAPDVGNLRREGVCCAHIPTELREKGFTDKSYRGYFRGVHEPTGSALIYFIELDSVGKNAHVIFDEVAELKRDVVQTLRIQEERRIAGDFERAPVSSSHPST